MELVDERIYRTSRRAYLWNYVLAGLVGVFLFLLITTFGLTFTLFPHSVTELWNTLAILGVFMIISVLSEEPILAGMIRHYIVSENEIIQVEGILRKKKFVLPYQGIADVRVTKGIFGRLLNYGDVEVFGFKENIEMKGMANPDRIQKILQEKMSKMRGGIMSRRKHVPESNDDYVELKDK